MSTESNKQNGKISKNNNMRKASRCREKEDGADRIKQTARNTKMLMAESNKQNGKMRRKETIRKTTQGKANKQRE